MDQATKRKPMTLRALRDRLNACTEEQLDDFARWTGEDCGGAIVSVDVLAEEYIDVGEGAEPMSAYRGDPPPEHEIIGRWPAGTVLLMVD